MNTRAYSKTDNVFRRMMNFTLEMAKKKKKKLALYFVCLSTPLSSSFQEAPIVSLSQSSISQDKTEAKYQLRETGYPLRETGDDRFFRFLAILGWNSKKAKKWRVL